MVDEWWVTEEPPQPVKDATERLPPPPAPPIIDSPASSRWNFEEALTEELMAPHYTRLKIIVITPFAIVFSSAIVPLAILLILPYFLYVIYSIISALYRLRGTAFKWGLMIVVGLSIPAAVSAYRYNALYDGCIGFGGWVCRDNTNYGPSFNPLLLALPLAGGIVLLPSMSELRQGTIFLGMIYGFVVSVLIWIASVFVGIGVYYSN